jgi:hypothetical protein
MLVPIESIVVDWTALRRDDNLSQLKDSLMNDGFWPDFPLTVVAVGDKWLVVKGRRVFAAAARIGMKEVFIRDASPMTQREIDLYRLCE